MQWISTIEINSLNNVNLTAIWEGNYDFPFFCPLLNLLSLALVADIFCLIFASGVRVMLSLRRGFGGRLVIIELFESENFISFVGYESGRSCLGSFRSFRICQVHDL